jgi:hypothetical protein
MPKSPAEILLTFPPRALARRERDLVAEWLSLASDIPSAYVSTRRLDDPAMYRRIIVAAHPDASPTHIIHAPSGMRLWVKLTIGGTSQVEMFSSLACALNSIRRVLE